MAYGGEPDTNSSTERNVHTVTAVALSCYDNHSHYKVDNFISCDELG